MSDYILRPALRRAVVTKLREIKELSAISIGNWSPHQTEWDFKTGKRVRVVPNEKLPENNAEDWDRLDTYLAAIIAKARHLQKLCADATKALED